MAMAHGDGDNAANHVQILPTLGIPQELHLAAHHMEGLFVVGLDGGRQMC